MAQDILPRLYEKMSSTGILDMHLNVHLHHNGNHTGSSTKQQYKCSCFVIKRVDLIFFLFTIVTSICFNI